MTREHNQFRRKNIPQRKRSQKTQTSNCSCSPSHILSSIISVIHHEVVILLYLNISLLRGSSYLGLFVQEEEHVHYRKVNVKLYNLIFFKILEDVIISDSDMSKSYIEILNNIFQFIQNDDLIYFLTDISHFKTKPIFVNPDLKSQLCIDQMNRITYKKIKTQKVHSNLHKLIARSWCS